MERPMEDLDMSKPYEDCDKAFKMSKHATKRAQQRGISRRIIEIITLLGKPISRPGNATEFRINKRDKNDAIKILKKIIHLLDKSSNVSVILDSDMDEVITVYHRN
jgi:hypothetical protein